VRKNSERASIGRNRKDSENDDKNYNSGGSREKPRAPPLPSMRKI
jgi:hypothetical protein